MRTGFHVAFMWECCCPTRRTGSSATTEASYNFSAINDVLCFNFLTIWSFDSLENERVEQKQAVVFLVYELCQLSNEIISCNVACIGASHYNKYTVLCFERKGQVYNPYHPFYKL